MLQLTSMAVLNPVVANCPLNKADLRAAATGAPIALCHRRAGLLRRTTPIRPDRVAAARSPDSPGRFT